MEMTTGEVKRNYAQAKNKAEQIKILAQLNECSEDEIKVILGIAVEHPKQPCTYTEIEIMRNWLEENLNRLEMEIREREIQYKQYADALIVLGEFEERNK